MRTLTTIVATLGVVGAIAVGSAAPAAAWYGYHHRYYNSSAAVPGMGAHRVGPSKAAFVSRIIMARGTGMGIVIGTGTVNRSLEAASVGRPSFIWLVLKAPVASPRWPRSPRLVFARQLSR